MDHHFPPGPEIPGWAHLTSKTSQLASGGFVRRGTPTGLKEVYMPSSCHFGQFLRQFDPGAKPDLRLLTACRRDLMAAN